MSDYPLVSSNTNSKAGLIKIIGITRKNTLFISNLLESVKPVVEVIDIVCLLSFNFESFLLSYKVFGVALQEL